MNKEFNKGLLLAGFGSFWWGFFGVIYFKYIAYIGHIELVVHRCLWTAFTLILTTFFFSKWNIFFQIVKNKLKLFYLFISGFLIFINWGVWIYAIATNRIIDASFGYFIMPILSVMLGYLFFKEKLSKKRVFSITSNINIKLVDYIFLENKKDISRAVKTLKQNKLIRVKRKNEIASINLR